MTPISYPWSNCCASILPLSLKSSGMLPKAFLASLAQKATGKHVLILTGANQEEVRLYHDLALFTTNPVIDFPAWETLPGETTPPSPDVVGDRYKVLRAITTAQQPLIILGGLQASLQKVIDPTTLPLFLFIAQGRGDLFF